MSSLADNEVAICNQALALIGIPAIQSLADTDDVSATCDTIYETQARVCLAKRTWRFASKKLQLTKSGEVTPVGEYPYAYGLPGDLVGGISHIFDTDADGARPYKNFEIFEGYIYTDAEYCYVDYKIRPEETEWPEYFIDYFVAHLAHRLAEILTDDTEKSDRAYRLAYGMPSDDGMGGLYREARRQDSQQQPSSGVQDFPLVDARFGGY